MIRKRRIIYMLLATIVILAYVNIDGIERTAKADDNISRVIFSAPSGFYDEEFNLEITAEGRDI